MRLDHLLSKEHHETQDCPADRGVAVSGRFVGWAAPCSGVGSGAQQTCRFFRGVPPVLGVRAGGISLNTLLGFETTSPRRLFALSGEPGAVFTGCFLVGGGRWRPVQGCGCCRPALVVGCGV